MTLDYDALQGLDDFDLSVFNNASHNLSEDYGFNPASQLVSRALSNPDYMQSGALDTVGAFGGVDRIAGGPGRTAIS